MTPIRKKALGDRLRVARHHCELSQDEVAELLGVKRQTVSAWETGLTVPTALQIADLAAAYCASAHLLLFGTHYERVNVRSLFPSHPGSGEQAIPREQSRGDALPQAILPLAFGAPPLPDADVDEPLRQPATWLGSILGRSGTP